MMHVFVYNEQSWLKCRTGPGQVMRPPKGAPCFHGLFHGSSGVTIIWSPVSRFSQEKIALSHLPSLKINLLVQIYCG